MRADIARIVKLFRLSVPPFVSRNARLSTSRWPESRDLWHTKLYRNLTFSQRAELFGGEKQLRKKGILSECFTSGWKCHEIPATRFIFLLYRVFCGFRSGYFSKRFITIHLIRPQCCTLRSFFMEKKEQSDRTSYDTNLLIRVFCQARYLTKDQCESL